MTLAHRAQLERRRARLAAELDELRPTVQDAWREHLRLEREGTDPRLLAFAEEAVGRLEDRCHALARAIVAIDDELGEEG